MEMIHPKAQRRVNGWTDSETALLMQAVQGSREAGLPVRTAFDDVARQTGRKPNSVRNYYYLTLRNHPDSGQPVRRFTCFTQEEKKTLLETVLTRLAEGCSVRSSVNLLARGDERLALRYQNKYRSLVKHHPELVQQVLEEARAKGAACCDPYARKTELRPEGITPGEMGRLLGEALADIDPVQALQLMGCLTALATRAADRAQTARKAEAYERLSVRYDMLMLQMQALMEKLPQDAAQNA